jgi:hypothetical protein
MIRKGFVPKREATKNPAVNSLFPQKAARLRSCDVGDPALKRAGGLVTKIGNQNWRPEGQSAGGAVPSALQDAEIDTPGADGLAVLVGHEAGQLVEMCKVVHGPGSEELAESDGTEGGMAATALEVLRLKI